MRAIVADDEPLAVRRLIAALGKTGKVDVVGVASDGAEALVLIARLRPDLAILDIAMPAINGIDVIEAIDAEHPPAIIFVSAHRQYALDAFRTGAVDYLLKPLDGERFQQAVNRAEAALASRSAQQRIDELRNAVGALRLEEAKRAEAEADNAFWVTAKGQVKRIPLSHVLWLGSDGDYVRIRTADEEHFVHDSLRALQERLDAKTFVRVHRQAMVRVDAISSITRGRFGTISLHLANGDEVRVGRSYRSVLNQIGPVRD